MMDAEKLVEDRYEREVWLRAWCAVASSFNAKAPDCDRYADWCLKSYRARFDALAKEVQANG